MLVAVHPWDVHGAKAAGLRAAWIDRTGAPYPETMYAADVVARSLPDLAARLEALPAGTSPGPALPGRTPGGHAS